MEKNNHLPLRPARSQTSKISPRPRTRLGAPAQLKGHLQSHQPGSYRASDHLPLPLFACRTKSAGARGWAKSRSGLAEELLDLGLAQPLPAQGSLVDQKRVNCRPEVYPSATCLHTLHFHPKQIVRTTNE